MYEEIIGNRYIGAAAIIAINEKSRDSFRFVNVNERYINEMELNVSVSDFLKNNYFEFVTDAEKNDFCKIAMAAAQKGESTECDYKCRNISECKNSDEMHLTSRIVFIEKIDDDYYFFEEIYNNNKHTSNLETLAESDRRFRIAYDQINIYSWEYTVADHTMRPCFRCMRDLGLPPVLENYPESAIERGIIPENYAGLFRQWHKALDMGEKELETILPLTNDRIPFRVRYTAEYDSEGKPYKAYGSATLVTDDELRARAASAERLEQALESVREANETKTRFLGKISHNLRTPLNAVVGFTSLAKINIDDRDKTVDYLEKIENSSSLLLRILNDILDITKAERGDIKFTEEIFDTGKEIEVDDSILEGKRILVVDDQAVNRVIVKEMLKRYGIIVDEAEDGRDALQKVESADERYDAILMDVQMPVMNGYEATERIRAMDDLAKASIPIFAMTADAFADDKIKARNSGMNEHIAKPIDINIVVELIKKFIS